ncbi:MAG: nucleotidyltransferase family protein [Chloroflexi bacterium]|nr:nucleotidyltransferase family protein [Chloroflexota bacterium]
MLTKEEITEILREKRSYLASEYGVKRIGVFGSYAKGLSTETSDIDIIVEFERPIGFRFIEFIEHLESLLGKSVDVLTPAGIQGIRVDRVARSIEESVVYV